MQNEYKVIRLEGDTINIHCSYLIDEMSPDAVVPYLVERRLLSPEKAVEVVEMSSDTNKVGSILKALGEKGGVGKLSTFCAALISAGQQHIADRLTDSE